MLRRVSSRVVCNGSLGVPFRRSHGDPRGRPGAATGAAARSTVVRLLPARRRRVLVAPACRSSHHWSGRLHEPGRHHRADLILRNRFSCPVRVQSTATPGAVLAWTGHARLRRLHLAPHLRHCLQTEGARIRRYGVPLSHLPGAQLAALVVLARHAQIQAGRPGLFHRRLRADRLRTGERGDRLRRGLVHEDAIPRLIDTIRTAP